MPIQHPTLDELTRVAHLYHLHPTPQDLASFCGLMAPTLESYARLDRLTEPTLPVKYPRSPGARPQPQDNALGAWYWRCEITGAPHGLLAGKTVAIKDNVCVAGIPMMNGTSVLEGYVPEIDATSSMRVGRFSARPSAKASVSLAGATRRTPGPCAIRTIPRGPRGAPPAAVPPS